MKSPQKQPWLYKLCSLYLSFGNPQALSIDQLRLVLLTLEKLGVRRAGRVKIGFAPDVQCHHLASDLPSVIDLMEERLSSGRTAKHYVVIEAELQFEFGVEPVTIEFRRSGVEDSLALALSQGSFMRSGTGPYIQERIEALYQILPSVLNAVPFMHGMIAVEDLVLRMSDYSMENLPCADWAYWSSAIESNLPEETLALALATAIEVREIGCNGRFWIWSRFGERVAPKLQQSMLRLQQAIVGVLNRQEERSQ